MTRSLLLVLVLGAAPAALSAQASRPATPAPVAPGSAAQSAAGAPATGTAPSASAPQPFVQAPTDTATPAAQIIGWIRPGQTRGGRLENGDYQMGDRTWADVWYFLASAGQRIEVTVSSRAFEAYVQLLDPVGDKQAESQSGKSVDFKVTWTVPAAGRYQIVVNSQGSDQKTGPYTLQLTNR